MIIIDSSADNLPAINFFKKQGFDDIQEHLYMTLNLSRKTRRRPEEEVMTDRREKVQGAINSARLRRTCSTCWLSIRRRARKRTSSLYLEEQLNGAGFAVERQEVEEDRYNLRVTMGRGEPQLYLVGHVDTVPAWDLEEFGAREEEGIIRGLGSADMKGGCAAMLEAWLALAEAIPPRPERPPVGLLLVVGRGGKRRWQRRISEACRPPPGPWWGNPPR